MIGFAILKAMDLKDATDWVFAGFWTGGLVGGLLSALAWYSLVVAVPVPSGGQVKGM